MPRTGQHGPEEKAYCPDNAKAYHDVKNDVESMMRVIRPSENAIV